MALRYHLYDVFTSTPYTGNPLAIVEDADALSDAQMQHIAVEFNLSETIFLRAPRSADHIASARIFTPKYELPFAGHPTIGAAIFLAETHGLSNLVIEEVAGDVPVTIPNGANDVARFKAPIIPFAADTMAPTAQDMSRALGVSDADTKGFRTGVFEGGPRFIYGELASREALSRVKPCQPAFDQMAEKAGTDACYVFVQTGAHSLQARMVHSYSEDPATGSASAILAAFLLQTHRLNEGANRWTLTQGVEMGRPSQITLDINVKGGTLSSVYIEGAAVRIASGMLTTIPAL
ncbi:MAG: PhzF family phenazine biosynthesis protein [Halocynthiibacter sp.]